MAGTDLPAEAYHPDWIAANLHGDIEGVAKVNESLALTDTFFPDHLSLGQGIIKHEVSRLMGKSKWYGPVNQPGHKPARIDLSHFIFEKPEEPEEPPAKKPRLEEPAEPVAVEVLPEPAIAEGLLAIEDTPLAPEPVAVEVLPALEQPEPAIAEGLLAIEDTPEPVAVAVLPALVDELPEEEPEEEPEWTTCHAGTLCRSNVPVVQACANPEPMNAFLDEYAESKSKKVRALCALYRADLTSVAENGFSLRDDDFFSTVEIDSIPWMLIMKEGNDQRCFRPVGKLYTIAFPTRGGMTAMKQFRAKVVKAFLKLGTTRGNVGLPDESAVVDFKALEEHYRDLSNEDFIAAVGGARLKASRGGDLDKFENALLANQVQPLMMQTRKNREDLAKAKSACVYHIENDAKLVEFRRGRDFTPEADSLEYQRFNPETGVADKVTDLEIDKGTSWKVYSQMVNGDAGIGKTPLHIAKAINYCVRKGKKYFVRCKGSIEPLVILSKMHVLEDAGAVILEDFDLYAARGALTNEELKALFDVRDGGVIESKRWGHITFPPQLPRLFSFNDSALKLLNVFGDPTSHQQAQLKRVCVAGYSGLVKCRLIARAAVQVAAQLLEEDNEIEQQRERDYWLSRDGRANRE